MLILTGTIRPKNSCCGNCRQGKPCCGTKAKPRPAFEKRRGIWLPKRALDVPKNWLQYPSEAEWGGLWRPWAPLLAQVLDFSCYPCCAAGCCEDNPAVSCSAGPVALDVAVSSACAQINGCTGTVNCNDTTGGCPASTINLGGFAGVAGCGDVNSICVYCADGAWAGIMSICVMPTIGHATIFNLTMVSVQCNPFSLVMTGTVDETDCCTTGDTVTVTITE